MPTVRDGNITLGITLYHPPAPGTGAPVAGGTQFLSWWVAECATRGVPAPRLTGADRAIARRLVNKHGLGRLKTLGVHYFRRHHQTGDAFEMVLFSSRIPAIETELTGMAS